MAESDRIMRRIGDEPDTPEKKNRVRKTFFYVWTAVGAIILVGVLIYLMHVLALPVSMLIWTLVIVFCLRGVVSALTSRGMKRLPATALSYVIMFAVLAAVAFLMFSPVFGLNEQFADLARNVPHYIAAIAGWADGVYVKYSAWFDNETVKSFIDSAVKSLSDWGSSFASGAANTVMDVGGGIASSFMAIGFALVVAFWILMELPAIGAEAKRLIDPRYYEDAHFLHITFTRVMGGYLKGTLVQCLIIGVACGILFAVAGVPNAPALGVITGVLNIIPIVGPWLGGAAAAIAAFLVSPIVAVIALVGTIAIQQFVYTFVSPKIMANSVDIHPALTLFAMMVGSAIGGAMSGLLGSLVGMLVSIPAVALLKALFVYYFEKNTGRQVVSADGVFFKGGPAEEGSGIDPLNDATSYQPKAMPQERRIIERIRRKR